MGCCKRQNKIEDIANLQERYCATLARLMKYGQEHLLSGYADLDSGEKATLLGEIEAIDFDLLNSLYKKLVLGEPDICAYKADDIKILKKCHDSAHNVSAQMGEKSDEGDSKDGANGEWQPLSVMDTTKMPIADKGELYARGLCTIKAGKLAALTMAGGQGTRLGHNGPKGTYDIGLDSHKSLFEIQLDGIKQIVAQAGTYIDWYIMTSQINHADSVAFFETHDYFGYPKEHIHFFPQMMIEALTDDGKVQLSDRCHVLKSPNGNGGMFVSLKASGLLDEMKRTGIEYVFVCGIDNCLVKMADPAFLGALLSDDHPEAATKTVLKVDAHEKAGVYCKIDGKPHVVEYTEVPEEYATAKNDVGEWIYGDCNVLNYIFTVETIEKLLSAEAEYHLAVKKLEFYDNKTKEMTTCDKGYKFELFLFDNFTILNSLTIVRINREDGFAPVKNKTGVDSAESGRRMFMDYQNAHKTPIAMTTPLVEMDGDEMTRVIWQKIKDIVIRPYVDLKTEYYDLGIENRDRTEDAVTRESAEATKKYGVAVKCATITPNQARVEEFGLKKMWKSPNATIRAALDGTVFRAPILVRGITPLVPAWEKPITIARHAYGDIYLAVESKVSAGSKAELVVTDKDGNEQRLLVKDFADDGIVMGMHNRVASIQSFARSCFQYALDLKQDLWFSAKDTISKTYDHTFKDIFQEIYDAEFKAKYEEAGISYLYTLVDDAIARVMRSKGGFLWACKNYDGDVFSDMLATAFGSLAMMTSVLVSPKGYYEFEAAHGTIPRHYHKYLAGEATSTNPVATLFAWTGALAKRAELDGNENLFNFAKTVERITINTIESGHMTGDLALISTLPDKKVLSLDEFLTEVATKVGEAL